MVAASQSVKRRCTLLHLAPDATVQTAQQKASVSGNRQQLIVGQAHVVSLSMRVLLSLSLSHTHTR